MSKRETNFGVIFGGAFFLVAVCGLTLNAIGEPYTMTRQLFAAAVGFAVGFWVERKHES